MDTNYRHEAVERFDNTTNVRESETRGPTVRRAPPAVRATSVEFGSGWYHAEAIKQAAEIQGHADRW